LADFGIHAQLTNPNGGSLAKAVRGQNDSTSFGGFGVWGSHAGGGDGVGICRTERLAIQDTSSFLEQLRQLPKAAHDSIYGMHG